MDLSECFYEMETGNRRRHPWEWARVKVVYHLLEAHLAGRKPGSIWDIGCGDAFVLEEFSRRYPSTRCVGVDTALTSELLAILQRRLDGRKVELFKNLREATMDRSQADALLLLDVIEHVEDDIGFLEELRQSPLISADTSILVTAPAFQRLYGRHDALLNHRRRYDYKLMIERICRAGFRIERAGQFFLFPLGLRAAQIASERWLGRKPYFLTDAARWTGGAFLTSCITTALLFDFMCSNSLYSLGIRLPGLSNYALCKAAL